MPNLASILRAIACLSLVLPASGCSLHIGAPSSFQITGHGIGATATEAERDAWRDATDRLRSMGYSSFHLDQRGTSSSGSSSGGNSTVKYEVQYEVTNAKSDCPGACTCRQRDYHRHGNSNEPAHSEH